MKLLMMILLIVMYISRVITIIIKNHYSSTILRSIAGFFSFFCFFFTYKNIYSLMPFMEEGILKDFIVFFLF